MADKIERRPPASISDDASGMQELPRPPVSNPVAALAELVARIDAGETSLAAEADTLRGLLVAVAHARSSSGRSSGRSSGAVIVGSPSKPPKTVPTDLPQDTSQDSPQNSRDDIFGRIAAGRSDILKLRNSARLGTDAGSEARTGYDAQRQSRTTNRDEWLKQATLSVGLVAIIAAIPAGLALLQLTMTDTGSTTVTRQLALASPTADRTPISTSPSTGSETGSQVGSQARSPAEPISSVVASTPEAEKTLQASTPGFPEIVALPAVPGVAPGANPGATTPPETNSSSQAAALQPAAPAPVQADLDDEMAELATRAQAGDLRAQYDFGLHYLRGDRVDESQEQAAAWLAQAANGGLAAAQYNLAVLYNQGQGVPQDHATALEWFEQAADQGHPKAQYALGVARSQGQTLPQDHLRAAEWFAMAADQGLGEAMYALALYAEQGLGQAVDLETALSWYRLADEYGVADAGPIAEEIAQHLDALGRQSEIARGR